MININNKTKSIIQGSFLVVLMLVTTYLVTSSLDIDMLVRVVKILDYKYILLGFILMGLYILLEGYIINLIIKSISGTKNKFLGFKIGTIGLYYNLITPMASGSQPMQVYELSKVGISTSQATAVVVNKSTIFQTVVTLYCGIFSVLNLDVLQNDLKSIFIFIVFGMIMNVVMLGFVLFIVCNPLLTKSVAFTVLNTLSKIKFLRFLENKYGDVNLFIDEYNKFVKMFIKDKKSLIKSLLFTFLQLTIYFSIAYCIGKALNLNSISYVHILSLQVFLYMAVSSLPTPGNIGANEIAFFTIFARVIPSGLLGYSVFLYGIFVYYFLLIICGLFTILNKFDRKDKIKYYFIRAYDIYFKQLQTEK